MVSWTNIFSGKFIFTVITALVFAWCCYAKVLNGEQAYGVIMLVVSFYFSKQDPNTSQTSINAPIQPIKAVQPIQPSPTGDVK